MRPAHRGVSNTPAETQEITGATLAAASHEVKAVPVRVFPSLFGQSPDAALSNSSATSQFFKSVSWSEKMLR